MFIGPLNIFTGIASPVCDEYVGPAGSVLPSLAYVRGYGYGSDFPSWCRSLPLSSRGMGASSTSLTIEPSAASLGQAPPR